MKILFAWVVRFLVYGAIVAVTLALTRFSMVHFGLSISSELISKIVAAFVALMAVIHAIGLQAYLKTLNIHKATPRFGYLQAERLSNLVESKLKSSICRIVYGIFCAVLSGVVAAILYAKGNVPANWVEVGFSLALLLSSVYVGVAAVFEFHVVSQLDAELLAKEDRERRKAEALKALSSDDKSE